MKSYPVFVGGEERDTGIYGYQFNMERIIEDPGILVGWALDQTMLGRLPSFIIRRLRGSSPEARFILRYVRAHGRPRVSRDKIEDAIYARYSLARPEDVRDSISLAYRARRKMYKSRTFNTPEEGLSIEERGELLLKVGDEIRKLRDFYKEISFVEGKPLRVFEWEFTAVDNMFTRDFVRFNIDLIDEKEYPSKVKGARLYVIRQPYGVTVLYPPYNAAIGLGLYAIFSSLLAGNPTIVKPSSKNPLSNLLLAPPLYKAMSEYDVTSALSAVVGSGKNLIKYFLEDERVSCIIFYGESEPGLQVMSMASLKAKKVLPELAGSDPCIIWGDVDVEKAAEYVAKYRFLGSGQFCMAIKRVIVDQRLAKDFLAYLVEEAEKYRPGLPSDPNTSLAILPPNVMERAEQALRDARAKGARVITGGRRVDYTGEEDPAGLFLEATVVVDVKPDMVLGDPSTEAFYPVLPVYTVDSLEQAVKIANSSKYGLRASIITDDEHVKDRLAVLLESGGVLVNSSDHMHLEPYMPNLGGVKWSGIIGSKYFPLELTTTKWVYIER